MTKTHKKMALLLTLFLVLLGSGCLYSRSVDNRTPAPVGAEPKQEQRQSTENKQAEPPQKQQEETEKPAAEAPEDQQKPAIPAETTTAQGVSNEKYSWYFKPNDQHLLPEVNAKGKELLDQYQGIYHGDTSGKNIYLTFDEGYENGYTPMILDALKAANVKAAFFITGDYIRRNPELVQRMANEGHVVGNHTDHHPSLPSVDDATLRKELTSLSDAYKQLTGREMSYLRPPMGEYSARTLKITREMGYTNVFWSVAMKDWIPDAGTPQEHQTMVMSRLHNGALILLHAVNKANAEMLPSLIEECRQQGYQFKALDER
ncbi:delta-lactam-biosynthetic de-N-acetylase [Desulforamulus ruminis]|uniref:delta-lactam-biosynthetic de-N-acetylase n=1 Tax=Desulforamulus ruminis TaxID=1564 RepID=UPI002356A012|nr:delta-lactam-biosynthetic de-N-acetylase [Desulforamulus ruminis]